MANVTAQDLNRNVFREIFWVTYFIGLETVLGFIGNVIVILVFAFRYHRCNFCCFVLCLGILDLFSVFTTLPGEMVTQIYWYIYPPIEWFCKLKSFFNMFTITGEAFCLCAIALDRFLKLYRPHGWQIRQRQAVIICAVIFVMASILAAPDPLLWGMHKYTVATTNVTVVLCEKDQDYLDSGRHHVYISAASVITACVLVATIALYVPLACSMQGQRKDGHRVKANDTHISRSRLESGSSKYIEMVLTSNVNKSEQILSKTNIITNKDNGDIGRLCISKSKSEEPQSTQDVMEPTTSHEPSAKQMYKTKSTESVHITNVNVVGNKETANMTRDARNRKRVTKWSGKKSLGHRTKTKIPIILSAIFTSTSLLYMSLLAALSDNTNFVHGNYGIYLFALRLVFINHVINPFVYWFLDREFQEILRRTIYNMFTRIR
ncbi:hypothetical protein DPMN_062754 [Dreissena polymorpha]|uniref:G-protein coupled receptors family 1 profile domain-containing protein n=1 Tax=Dreissena polymorpha TaxID=45954 RepID=A0A9D4HI07_DREPO|nr:hypothetical protein DPMN_062754 [Dreissena polymorpha]